jgi:single-strand DNA-binding protein
VEIRENMDFNKVILIGRLVSDPETRSTSGGQTVCNFRLATNRIWTDSKTGQKQQSVEYHNIILWRRLAEIASQFLTKGSLAMIEGRLQTRTWQDSSGNKRYKTEIIAQTLQLGPRIGRSSESGQNPEKIMTNKKEEVSAEEIPIIQEGGDEEINIADIPF